MINAKSLFDSFLGSSATLGQPANPASPATGGATSPWLNPGGGGGLMEAASQALRGSGGMGGMAASGAAGGLLGMLAGGKRKGGLGGVLSHGGAAMLGALTSQAFASWQQGRNPAQAPAVPPPPTATVEPRFLPAAAPASNGQPFELALIRAMIAAAKSDGHVDAEEQRRIFARVEQGEIDPEGKAFIFDALSGSAGITDIATLASTPEQAAELYLASRLAVDADHPAERAWLEALAHALKLPQGLAVHLEQQAQLAAEPAT